MRKKTDGPHQKPVGKNRYIHKDSSNKSDGDHNPAPGKAEGKERKGRDRRLGESGKSSARRTFDRKNNTDRTAKRKPEEAKQWSRPEKKFKRENESEKPERKKQFDKNEKKTFRPRTDRKEPTEGEERLPYFKKELPEKPARVKRSYPDSAQTSVENGMTLNKYIAHSGTCSRREAAEMVKQGKVRVNGELILDPGYRVAAGDTIALSGKKLTPQKHLVYILLNKPKGYLTTTDDPEDRKTVMDLVANSGAERLFPVGRLDRNTTGVLLLTNDGALAHRLSHPSFLIKKVYHVTLDKNLTRAHYEQIVKGLELEDGPVQVDEIAYLENRKELGLEIHSGRNRIVRRIFESLGYVVEKLDRVMYAGLTKKNVSRGKWRQLTEKEVIFLKHFKG